MKKNDVIDELAVNTLRMLALDMVQKANSGHPGLPLGDADVVYILWQYFLKHNPGNPAWINRDRFILSSGHGSALLYALLHSYGYDISRKDIMNFRQYGSKTPGHPEYPEVPGVEVTTGPLGQGFATGVGMAMGQRNLQARYPQLDYHVYAICSDGDMMEGISHEAASIAGHLHLGNMIYVYLDNRITIEGKTGLTFTEDVAGRFISYGWQVIKVDGYNHEDIKEAFSKAQEEKTKPSLIIARTTLGKGVPGKEDTAAVHGAPLTPEELTATKKNINWPPDKPFYMPEKAKDHFSQAIEKGKNLEDNWLKGGPITLDPPLASGWEEKIQREFKDDKMATRKASGKIINDLAPVLPGLFGGSADLGPSCNTMINGGGDFSSDTFGGRNIRFGIREHAMGAIQNGLARTPGIIPYGSTFLVFSDYMRPAIRLAALMKLQTIYVFTHDSIFLGEDGPTHQPVEHLAALRAIPNLTVIRPADASEVTEAWIAALKNTGGPTAIILTRQSVPVLDRNRYTEAKSLHQGAYIISGTPESDADLTLYASGSEVSLALAVKENLPHLNIEVINVPSFELFAKTDPAYRKNIIDRPTRKVVIEAGSSFGWEKFAGNNALLITINGFGASGPAEVLKNKFGFNRESICSRIREWL